MKYPPAEKFFYPGDPSRDTHGVAVGRDGVYPIRKFAVPLDDPLFALTGGWFGDIPELRPVSGRLTYNGVLTGEPT